MPRAGRAPRAPAGPVAARSRRCGRRSSPARLAAGADPADPRLVRLLHGVPPSPHGRRLVADGPDLGSRSDSQPIAAILASRPLLGGRPVILRLTPKTAALVGETPGRVATPGETSPGGAMDLRPADGGGPAASARSGARGAGAGGRRAEDMATEQAAATACLKGRLPTIAVSTAGSSMSQTLWWRSDGHPTVDDG